MVTVADVVDYATKHQVSLTDAKIALWREEKRKAVARHIKEVEHANSISELKNAILFLLQEKL